MKACSSSGDPKMGIAMVDWGSIHPPGFHQGNYQDIQSVRREGSRQESHEADRASKSGASPPASSSISPPAGRNGIPSRESTPSNSE